MKSQLIYLDHISTAIEKIKRYTNGMSFDDFYIDDKTQDAVIRQIEIIGEAANQMDATFRKTISGVKWRQIIGMRNKLIHDYAGVLPDRVWEVVCKDIPALSFAVSNYLANR